MFAVILTDDNDDNDDDYDDNDDDDDDDGDALDDGCCKCCKCWKASSVKPTIVPAALSHQGFGPWRLQCNTISDILQYCAHFLCDNIIVHNITPII